MFRTLLAATLIALGATGSMLADVGGAEAANGRNAAFATGAVAGVVGGALLGGALAGPRYAEPVYGEPVYAEPAYAEPVYQPACYMARQRVPNRYDGGWHWEQVQVCR